MRATVVRLANVYGPRSNIGSPEFGFMNYFIGLALQGKKLTVFGQGNQLRTVSYIDDVVAALILAAQTSSCDGHALFAVSDVQHSVAQIAHQITAIIGGTVKHVEWPKDREAIEIGDAVISNQKIKEMLNWTPQFDLETGLTRTRDYFAPRLKAYLE
jgi:UDP-glucose 4-epimerase